MSKARRAMAAAVEAAAATDPAVAEALAAAVPARLPDAGHKPKRRSKYGAVRTEVDGITFDSKREAEHWLTLKALERGGEIVSLRRQVSITLFSPRTGKKVTTYRADFVYEREGIAYVIDCKGFATPVYKLKKRLLAEFLGVVIVEV